MTSNIIGDSEKLSQSSATDMKMMKTVFMSSTVLTTVLSGGTFAQQLASGGASPLQYGVVAGLTAALFLCIRKTWHQGIEVLPFKPKRIREKVMPIFVGSVILVTSISAGTSIPMVARDAAENAELARTVRLVNEKANEVINTRVYSARSFFGTNGNVLEAWRENEVRGGLWSATGKGGEGRHTEILDSLIAASIEGQNVVTTAHGRGKPLSDDIKQYQEAIRRANESDMPFAARVDFTHEHLTLITGAAQEFANLFPYDAVSSIQTLYAQDFDNLGLNPVAAAKLESLLHPAAQKLASDLATLKATSEIRMPDVGEGANPYVVIFRNIESVWILVLAAVSPECISILLLIGYFLSERRDGEAESQLEGAGVLPTGGQPLDAEALKQIEALLASQATKPNGLAGPATRLPSDLLDRFPSSDDRSNKPS